MVQKSKIVLGRLVRWGRRWQEERRGYSGLGCLLLQGKLLQVFYDADGLFFPSLEVRRKQRTMWQITSWVLTRIVHAGWLRVHFLWRFTLLLGSVLKLDLVSLDFSISDIIWGLLFLVFFFFSFLTKLLNYKIWIFF